MRVFHIISHNLRTLRVKLNYKWTRTAWIVGLVFYIVFSDEIRFGVLFTYQGLAETYLDRHLATISECVLLSPHCVLSGC